MAGLSAIGRPTGRIEGVEKVTGRAQYTADIILPGLLWGKCLRSPFPHARIVSIDTSRAKQLPGVHAVLTSADLPDTRTGRALRDFPVLARDKVRFVGEKVAAVAAESPDIAEEALTLIDVEYEELPAVFDPIEAMQEDAPRVHDDPAAYQGARPPASPVPNLIAAVVHRHGDIATGFSQADRIFEHTFFVPSVHHGYLEPHACVVQIEPDGKVNVWLSNKTPYTARSELARAIGIPEERIRVNLVRIGADFGGKGSLMDAPVCYYLAQRTSRPVKMVMTYTEELMAANPRHDAIITQRTGVTRDGRITARQVKVIFNRGAYGAFVPVSTLELPRVEDAGGPYRVPNLEIESLYVYTNTVPRGHMRLPGGQVIFSVESHTDMIAQELGLDPLEFRLRNALREGDASPLGEHWQDIHCEDTLRAAAEAANWGADKTPNVGQGTSLYHHRAGTGHSNVTLSIDATAHITMLTSIADTGTGAHTVLQQFVAEELQVPLATVHIVPTDTDTAPYDRSAGDTRVTYNAGSATVAAARELKKALIERAALLLQCAPEEVRFEGSRFVTNDGNELSLADLMAQVGAQGEAPITGSASFRSEERPDVTSFCAQVAEVEVDPETGQVKLRKVVTAHDVGTIINPLGHQGQIEGALAMGIGQALTEQLLMQEGAVATLNLGDYKLPTVADIPELQTVLVKARVGPAPYQAKPIGEISHGPIAAAIANAVFDAVGVRLTELPITAEKVYAALRAREGEA